MVREHPGCQERKRFMLGKYEIIAQPIPGSAHMLRYTVFAGGRRIGAMASMPTESDCKYLEKPPVVPKTRRPTKPSRSARKKRLEGKIRRGRFKQLRGKVNPES